MSILLTVIAVFAALSSAICAVAYLPIRRNVSQAYAVQEQAVREKAATKQIKTAAAHYHAANRKQLQLGCYACVCYLMPVPAVIVTQTLVALVSLAICSVALAAMTIVCWHFNQQERELRSMGLLLQELRKNRR